MKLKSITSPVVKHVLVVAILSTHCADVGAGDGSGVGSRVGGLVDGAGEVDGKPVGDWLGAGTGVGAGVPTDSQLVQQEQNMFSQSASRVSSSKEHNSSGMDPLKAVLDSFTSVSSCKPSMGGTVPVKALALKSRLTRSSKLEMPAGIDPLNWLLFILRVSGR